MYKEFSVNPIEQLKEVATHDSSLQLLVDDVGGWGIGQAEEVAEKLGLKCESENTYNNSDLTCHHDRVVQWHILSSEDDFIYDENAILLVEEHGGGDVRGNYLSMKAYKFNKYCSLEDLYSLWYVDLEDVEMEA